MATRIAVLLEKDPAIELHLVAHSAGAILLGPFVQLLTARGTIADGELAGSSGLGRSIATCTLWAPACAMTLFDRTYLPAIRDHQLQRFSLFTLTDEAEQNDDCAGIYHKSLLYLVSNALDERPRIPLVRDGVPLLGMEKFVVRTPALVELLGDDWVRAPNTSTPGSPNASTVRHHVDFDNDTPTLRATLSRILGDAGGRLAAVAEPPVHRHASGTALRERRERVALAIR